MSKARDLINAHLYPVLATFAVLYGAIQIAPIAQQARTWNSYVASATKNVTAAQAVSWCNGK